MLGPVFVLKLKFTPQDLHADWWRRCGSIPDDSRILELSTKCAPAETFHAGRRGRHSSAKQGLDLSGEQETKTRKALEFFSGR